jgi:hypothetical protein
MTNFMTTLFNEFMSSPLHIQGIMIFWSVCVVLFYVSFLTIIGNLFVNTIKKIF